MIAIFYSVGFVLALIPSLARSSVTAAERVCEIAVRRFELDQYLPPASAADPDLILKKMPAVHATNIFPSDGILRVGKSSNRVRQTVHFSLGEVVRSHPGPIGERQDWDNRTYAVVMPLGALAPQLVNVNAYDTFAAGPVKIPAGATLVVPHDMISRVPAGIKAYGYDPSKTTLRKATDEVIHQESFWSVEMKSDYDGQFKSSNPSLARARVGNKNINTPEFFSKLMDKKPYISFGDHSNSIVGNAFRFGATEDCVFMAVFAAYGGTTNKIQFYRRLVLHHLGKLKEAYATAPAGVQEVIREIEKESQAKLRILDAELFARKEYGISLGLSWKSEKLTDDPATWRKIIQKHQAAQSIGVLKMELVERAYREPDERAIAAQLSGLPSSEAMQFVETHRALLKKGFDFGLFSDYITKKKPL